MREVPFAPEVGSTTGGLHRMNEASRFEQGASTEANDSGFELLGPEGCKSVWHQLRAGEGGRMLQCIECESFSSNLISKHDRLFNASEREKLCGKERGWTVCVEVVEEALKRNPVGVLCAFYKALVDTQTSGGATQHTEIAQRMKTFASEEKRKYDYGLPHGTMESGMQQDGTTVAKDTQGSPLSIPGRSSGHSTPLSRSPRRQDYDLPATVNGRPHCSTIVKLPSMPIELQVISSTFLNGDIYVTGIATEKDEGSSQVQVYSLSESKWFKLPEAPSYNAPIVDINGRVTMIGGREGRIGNSMPTDILSTWCEEEGDRRHIVPSKSKGTDSTWLEKQGQWKRTLRSMPSSRVASGICYHDNLLLVTVGVEESAGATEECQVVDTIFVYNFSTQRWITSQVLQLPKALRSHHLVLCGKYIYLVGGAYVHPICGDVKREINSSAWRAKWSDICEAVKPTSTEQQAWLGRAVWTQIADPPTLRPTVISCQELLLSVGGISDGLPQNGIYKFVDDNSNSSRWIKVGSMSVGRYRHAVVPLGNLGAALFVAGGCMVDSPSGDEITIKTASAEMVLL